LAGVKEMANALYFVAKPYLESPWIFKLRMEFYAERANVVGLSTLFGGSLMKHWGGHAAPPTSKSCSTEATNGLTGSSSSRLLLQDGLFAWLFGPINGNQHDTYMFARLELIPKLQEFMPPADSDTVYSLYGDPHQKERFVNCYVIIC
jgi:hypothetical protein